MEILNVAGILLLIAGFVLMGIEMVLPGFSVPGVSGIICLVTGVFLLADSVMEAALITIAVLAILGVLLAVILSLFARGKLHSPIILEEKQDSAKGYISSNDLNYLLGKQGVAVTDLRPAGVAGFDGINFDVITEGNYISRDAEVEIIKVEGSKLIVKERGGKKNG